ncbi:MAG: enoyl-CoA hydratase/isomerase family protein [Rhodoferax sp.]
MHEGRMNAMSRAMWRALRGVFLQLQQEPGLRCVVVQGAGEHFCAGGDISEYPSFRFEPESLRAFHEDEVWAALQSMLDCELPLVASIAGNCMGAGVEIASCCDIRLAGQNARFGAPIARLGFPMAPREAALVARAVGDGVARSMLLGAQVFDAGHMLHTGFLSACVASGQLQHETEALVQRLLPLAAQAARANKRTLRALQGGAPVAMSGLEPFAYADSAEHREGISAFLEKRPPRF